MTADSVKLCIPDGGGGTLKAEQESNHLTLFMLSQPPLKQQNFKAPKHPALSATRMGKR